MNSSKVYWTFSLPDDVLFDPGDGGAFLRTASDSHWIPTQNAENILERLSKGACVQVQINDRPKSNIAREEYECNAPALLYRLDQIGLLVRHLNVDGRSIASCIPLRPPPGGPVLIPPSGVLLLSQFAVARADVKAISIEKPGSWAKLLLNERNLLGVLHDLSIGRTSTEITAALDYSEEAVDALLALMSWCELFDSREAIPWAYHELLFHTRIRAGYTREPPRRSPLPEPEGIIRSQNFNGSRIALQKVDNAQLICGDRTYADVMERRRSTRTQGKLVIDSRQLSEFLFRTFKDKGGRRPFPSGGARYPLNAYILVRECTGVAPGCYLYEATTHELIKIAESAPNIDLLMADAAGAANVSTPPQVLIVLAAQFYQCHAIYPDLGYSLILKEVGAVFQTAMMSAAAMSVATCPLGCGNSTLFAEVIGVDPIEETSVGELMLGSLP